jgi:uncharacterized membrane protein YecN with MAPEG domain
MQLTLPEGYAFVLFFNVLISLLCFIIGFFAGALRSSTFTKKFFETHFKDELMAGEVNFQGYPDVGSGQYSQKLPHNLWVRFNNAQRCHANFLEHLPIILIAAFISGLTYTRLTVLAQIVYIIGRIIYTIGYFKTPGRRVIGALTHEAALVTLIVTSIMTSLSLGGGLSKLTEFIVGK